MQQFRDKVFQLRPRSAPYERKISARWGCQLQRGLQSVRADDRVVLQRLSTLFSEIFPFPGDPLEDSRDPVRPLPTPIRPESDPGLALAERILSHLLWVILNLPRPGVQALHQTIRMALVAVTGLVFPEDTQTHQKSLAAEASLVGLQMMSGLLYLLLRPNLERSRMVRFLIPPSEGSILARGLA